MLNARRADGERVASRDQDGAGGFLGRSATILTAALLAATAGAALAPLHWLAELAVHFPVQYAVLALLAFVVLAWQRRVSWAVVALLVAAINTAIAAPEFKSEAPALKASAGLPLRAVAVNVLYRSHQYERVIEFVAGQQADVVTFVEVDETWREALRPLEKHYPHSFATRGRSLRGVVLLSRWPLQNATELALEGAGEPAISATVLVSGQPVRVLAVHTNWPMGALTARQRNRQLQQLAYEVLQRPEPAILVGDLNVSPFSPHFDALLTNGGLRSAAAGFGWQPTWPTFLPLAGIQIDHILISSDVAVQDFRRGPRVGSDHWPIIADLVLPGG